MDVVVGKLVGKLGLKEWAQVYDFTPEGDERLAKRGRLVAVVGMRTEEEVEQVEMVQVGREVLARLHEKYYGEESGTAFEVLKAAMGAVREEFGGIEIGGAVLVDGVIYVVAGEGTGVWVGISEKQGWLIKPEETREEAAFSGKAAEGEVLVIGNKGFFREVPEDLLRNVILTTVTEMESAVDMLAAVQRGRETSGGEAGAIIRITKSLFPENKLPTLAEVSEEQVKEEQPKREGGKGAVWLNLKRKLEGVKGRIYIRHGDRQLQRKRMMYMGVGFLVILLVMAGAGQWWFKQKTALESNREERLEKLLFNFNEAKAMIPLNPERSKQLLNQIKANLEELKKEKVKDGRLAEVEGNWEQVWLEAAGVVSVEFKELVDLNLVRKGIVGTKMTILTGKLMVLDGVTGKVVEVDEKTGATKVLAGGEDWKGATLLATYPERILVLTGKGIVDLGDGKVKVGTDKEWGEIVSMQLYAGNIYLLDKGAGQIWRYAVKTGGYSEKRPWLADTTNTEDIKNALGMAINGSIWVVKPEGLLKFTRGVNDGIMIEGTEKTWGEGAAVYTSDETEKVYILDPVGKKVVVLNKDGGYEKQLKNDGWGKIVDMVVDEKGGWAFGLGEGKIWSIKI